MAWTGNVYPAPERLWRAVAEWREPATQPGDPPDFTYEEIDASSAAVLTEFKRHAELKRDAYLASITPDATKSAALVAFLNA